MNEVTDPTWLSLLPALVTIALAFATRQVIPALFAGIVTGSLVLFAGSGEAADLNFISRFFLPAIGSHKYAQILLIYLWSLGGLIGIWEKTGGARHFAEQVGLRFSKSRRGSLFFVWLLGCVFHQGGTVSTVLTGSTAKPVTDRFRVSHEELSYVVDSTSSPIATILPFNAWPIYVGGLAAGTIALIPDDAAGFAFFLRALPFNFYAIFAVLSTLLFALELLPWVPGPMARARRRTKDGGPLDRPGASPMLVGAPSPTPEDHSDYRPHLVDFLVPLGLLLLISALPVTLGLGSFVNEAFMTAVLSAMLIARLRGMNLATIISGLVDGCAKMTIGAIVLGLAVTIAEVAKSLDTAGYLVGVAGGALPPVALPALLMLLCMVIAFATGTSWGTYAVVVPIALPLAWALQADPSYLAICLGAVVGGGVFGDQCSPISDTTILSSMFSGCDLMDHVRTQLPLALAAATLAALCSTLAAAAL
ncbi:MAG: sodium:proton antiporter [Deltaproteobacteria bacterium]|nr:sodium:proton antiporter [Deltaproteobacteria bacterium]MBW2419344.1 sodium:proton antiporter [Deltaproteobacteria bacterium]